MGGELSFGETGGEKQGVDDDEKLREGVERLIDSHVDIHDPESEYIYNMTGRVMDAKRREPIEVTLDNPTKAELVSVLGPAGISALSAASGSPDLITVGTALLSAYAIVAQGRSVDIEPDVALTYAVGWDMSNAGEETVSIADLEKKVIEESMNHGIKKEMDEKDVEEAVWQLRKMKSIRGEAQLKFREKCTVKYK